MIYPIFAVFSCFKAFTSPFKDLYVSFNLAQFLSSNNGQTVCRYTKTRHLTTNCLMPGLISFMLLFHLILLFPVLHRILLLLRRFCHTFKKCFFTGTGKEFTYLLAEFYQIIRGCILQPVKNDPHKCTFIISHKASGPVFFHRQITCPVFYIRTNDMMSHFVQIF